MAGYGTVRIGMKQPAVLLALCHEFLLLDEYGVVQPLIAAKWVANSPLVMVDQYVPSLKRYRAIAVDVGDKDPLGASNVDLDKALTRLGISHVRAIRRGPWKPDGSALCEPPAPVLF